MKLLNTKKTQTSKNTDTSQNHVKMKASHIEPVADFKSDLKLFWFLNILAHKFCAVICRASCKYQAKQTLAPPHSIKGG